MKKTTTVKLENDNFKEINKYKKEIKQHELHLHDTTNALYESKKSLNELKNKYDVLFKHSQELEIINKTYDEKFLWLKFLSIKELLEMNKGGK